MPGGIELQCDVLQQQQQQQQQQEHSMRRSERRPRGADVSPGISQHDGLPSQHSQAGGSVQASNRRVERAALLEQIKLLQQHHQGGGLS
jgi:hypothetical protein